MGAEILTQYSGSANRGLGSLPFPGEVVATRTRTEAESVRLGFRENIFRALFFDQKFKGLQAGTEILAVLAHMISLSKVVDSIFLGCDARILESVLAFNGYGENSGARTFENAFTLTERASVVGDVLQHVVADNRVEGLIGEGQVAKVRVEIHVVAKKVDLDAVVGSA